jgi:hypothetical protein
VEKGGWKEKNVYKRFLLELSTGIFHLPNYISLQVSTGFSAPYFTMGKRGMTLQHNYAVYSYTTLYTACKNGHGVT